MLVTIKLSDWVSEMIQSDVIHIGTACVRLWKLGIGGFTSYIRFVCSNKYLAYVENCNSITVSISDRTNYSRVGARALTESKLI